MKALQRLPLFALALPFAAAQADSSAELASCLRFAELGLGQASTVFASISAAPCNAPVSFEAFLRAKASAPGPALADDRLVACYERGLAFEMIRIFNVRMDACASGG